MQILKDQMVQEQENRDTTKKKDLKKVRQKHKLNSLQELELKNKTSTRFSNEAED